MINGLFIDDRGTKRYYLDGQLHRNDGPAVEYPDGSQFYSVPPRRPPHLGGG